MIWTYLYMVAMVADLVIDGSLKLLGFYLFFWKGRLIEGAILFGASGIYSISMAKGFEMRKSRIKEPTK